MRYKSERARCGRHKALENRHQNKATTNLQRSNGRNVRGRRTLWIVPDVVSLNHSTLLFVRCLLFCFAFTMIPFKYNAHTYAFCWNYFQHLYRITSIPSGRLSFAIFSMSATLTNLVVMQLHYIHVHSIGFSSHFNRCLTSPLSFGFDFTRPYLTVFI